MHCKYDDHEECAACSGDMRGDVPSRQMTLVFLVITNDGDYQYHLFDGTALALAHPDAPDTPAESCGEDFEIFMVDDFNEWAANVLDGYDATISFYGCAMDLSKDELLQHFRETVEDEMTHFIGHHSYDGRKPEIIDHQEAYETGQKLEFYAKLFCL